MSNVNKSDSVTSEKQLFEDIKKVMEASIVPRPKDAFDYKDLNNYTIYRTQHTLSITYSKEEFLVPTEDYFKPSVERIKKKQYEHHELKFVVFNGELKASHVRSSHYINEENNRVVRLTPFQANFAGRLASCIPFILVSVISEFIDSHFVIDKELTKKDSILLENYAEELSFVDVLKLSMIEKKAILELVLRMQNICFPIYATYLTHGVFDQRLDDGYFSYIKKDNDLKPFHKAQNYKDFILALCGVYKKNVAKALSHMSLKDILCIGSFSNVLDIDTCLHIFENANANNIKEDLHYDLSPLKNFPESIIKKLLIDFLLKDNVEDEVNIKQDALDMAPSIPPSEMKNCKTWQDLHDMGIMHFYDSDPTSGSSKLNKNIQYSENFVELFKENVNGLNMNPLHNPRDFIETGKEMDLCVGSSSYVSRAYKHEAYCFKLDNKDGKPYALIEIKKEYDQEWKIMQIKGYSNKSLNSELKDPLMKVLSKYIPMKG